MLLDLKFQFPYPIKFVFFAPNILYCIRHFPGLNKTSLLQEWTNNALLYDQFKMLLLGEPKLGPNSKWYPPEMVESVGTLEYLDVLNEYIN